MPNPPTTRPNLGESPEGRKSLLFVNKKKQKNFIHGARKAARRPPREAPPLRAPMKESLFASFSSEKEEPSFLVGAPRRTRYRPPDERERPP